MNQQKSIKGILSSKKLDKLYSDTINEEINSRQQLVEFNEKYDNAINEANIVDILNMLNKKDRKK